MEQRELILTLAQLSEEAANASDHLLASMESAAIGVRTLNGLNTRIQNILNGLDIEYHAQVNSVSIIENQEIHGKGSRPSVHAPQAHRSRESVTGATSAVSGVGKGRDASAAEGGRIDDAQSRQAAPDATSDHTEVAPGWAEKVLDRYAETGESEEELAAAFGPSSHHVLVLLRQARARGDIRVVKGDLKMADHTKVA